MRQVFETKYKKVTYKKVMKSITSPIFKEGDILIDRYDGSTRRIIGGVVPPDPNGKSYMRTESTYLMRPYPGAPVWQNFEFEYVEETYELDEESIVDRILTKYSNA